MVIERGHNCVLVRGASRFSDMSFLRKVLIPNRFLIRTVFVPKGCFSERFLFRKVFTPKIRNKTFRNKNHSEK